MRRFTVIACIVCAMASTSLRAETAAPASPYTPWPIPEGAGERALTIEPAQPIDQRQRYDLPSLIDLAQRNNPETRAAWEAAKAAAAEVGIIESTYLPQLSLQAIGGFGQTPLPAPKRLIPAGYFVSHSRELIPTLAIKWLLFDFGQRDAKREALKADSFVANVTFTAAHQKLVFAVSHAYFELGAATGRLNAARKALNTSLVTQDAARAKRANGLATVVAVAQADRQTAQARFNLTQAEGAEASARASLIAVLGVPADSQINVVDLSERPLPEMPEQTVSTAIRDALTHRPDVIAALGTIDAAEAALKAAERSHRPVIEMSAHVLQNMGRVSSDGQPASTVNKTGTNVLLAFKLPIYDGGEKASKVSVAKAKVRAAEAKLAATRDTAAAQVVKAYNDLNTSLAQYEAATAVSQAARIAYDAALRSFEQGVGSYTDLATEESSVALTDAQLEDARAAAHTAAAALAFAMGSLATDGSGPPPGAPDP